MKTIAKLRICNKSWTFKRTFSSFYSTASREEKGTFMIKLTFIWHAHNMCHVLQTEESDLGRDTNTGAMFQCLLRKKALKNFTNYWSINAALKRRHLQRLSIQVKTLLLYVYRQKRNYGTLLVSYHKGTVLVEILTIWDKTRNSSLKRSYCCIYVFNSRRKRPFARLMTGKKEKNRLSGWCHWVPLFSPLFQPLTRQLDWIFLWSTLSCIKNNEDKSVSTSLNSDKVSLKPFWQSLRQKTLTMMVMARELQLVKVRML